MCECVIGRCASPYTPHTPAIRTTEATDRRAVAHPARGAEIIRVALWVLIASVVVGALMGIWALLVGDIGDTQGRMLGTNFSITGAGALVIVFGRAIDRPGLGRLPYAGLGLTLATLAIINGGIWLQVEAEPFWKFAATLVAVAVTAAHASLVSPAGLAIAFRWVAWGAIGSGVVLAALQLVALWAEPDGSAIGRSIGVFAILTSAASIAVPVMRRLSRIPAPLDPSALVHFCPHCGEGLAEPPGEIECPHCGTRAHVEFSAG